MSKGGAWAPVFRTVGGRIRKARTDQGLTLRQAAEKSEGVHHTYWGQVERGQRDPSLHTLLRISKALGIDAGVLIRGIEPPRVQGGSGRPKQRRAVSGRGPGSVVDGGHADVAGHTASLPSGNSPRRGAMATAAPGRPERGSEPKND